MSEKKSTRTDAEWLELLARIRQAKRQGADRVQVDLDSDTVVGSRKVSIDHDRGG